MNHIYENSDRAGSHSICDPGIHFTSWIGMETAMSKLSLVINLTEPSLGTYSNYPINPHQLLDNLPCLDSFN